MNIVWGSVIIIIGIAFVILASVKSEFVIYRLFVAKSKMLWGDKVYRFHQVIGIALIIFGIVYAAGVI